MTTQELTINELGLQGDGIAKTTQDIVFVDKALPNERLIVNLRRKKDSGPRGDIVEILEASPDRAIPPCPHFNICGGCRFQHMKPALYRQFKQGRLNAILSRANISLDAIEEPIITAPETRRRARLAAIGTTKGTLLGFNSYQSHQIVDIQTCPVLLPRLQAFIAALRPELSTWLPVRSTADIQITLLPEGLDVVMIGGPKLNLDTRQNLADMASKLDIAHLSWHKDDRSPIEPISHRKPLPILFGETRLSFPPASFLQATQTGEEALTGFVKAIPHKGKRVLDLFSGLGTFGLSLESPKSVHFADVDGPAIDVLDIISKQQHKYTAERRNLMKDPFNAKECDEYDLVIFDPPRAGALAQAKELADSDVKNVVAISCDPTSFVRDAQCLIEGGYVLRRLLPVDQFLWSPHIELAAHFIKED